MEVRAAVTEALPGSPKWTVTDEIWAKFAVQAENITREANERFSLDLPV